MPPSRTTFVVASLLLLLGCFVSATVAAFVPSLVSSRRATVAVANDSQRAKSFALSVSSSPPPSDKNNPDDGNKKKGGEEMSSSSSFPPEEEWIGVGDDSGETTVDWDAEWKKVVQNKNQPQERPGSGYYKSETEIAAIRAANQAASKISKVQANVPSWQSLQGDWKFWIGILALVSVGISLLTSGGGGGDYVDTTGGGGGGSQGSYYI